MRTVFEPETLADAVSQASSFSGSCRFIFNNALNGGPSRRDVRIALEPFGALRFSGTAVKLFADLDTGLQEAPIVSLDAIVRSDERGLTRMLLSVLPEVDRIVIGVDDRTTDNTRRVAEAFADDVHVFGCLEAQMTHEQWQANRIHFANVRNAGRTRVVTPWTLFVDSDEFLVAPFGLREMLRGASPDTLAFSVAIKLTGFDADDTQRIARTECRWVSETHNQLLYKNDVIPAANTAKSRGVLIHDTSLRADAETERRNKQRRENVALWAEGAIERGDMNSVFHAAKQFICDKEIDKGLLYANAFRSSLLPRGPAAHERVYLAVLLSAYYYEVAEDFAQAELWAVRAFIDGPSIEAACILGDLAEDRGDLKEALAWYEFACVVEDTRPIRWGDAVARRFGRRDGIRAAIAAGTTEQPATEPVP